MERPTQSRITSRIVAEAGIPRLFAALADEISPADLQSLLVEFYQSRARKIKESGVLAQAERRALVGPSNVDARQLNQFDRIAFAAAENFEAVGLSPVGPLGMNFVLCGIDQNNLLTTTQPLVEISDVSITESLLVSAGSSRDEVRELIRAHRVRSAPDRVSGSTVSLQSESIGRPRIHRLVLANLPHWARRESICDRRRRLHRLDGADAQRQKGAASDQRDRQRVCLQAVLTEPRTTVSG